MQRATTACRGFGFGWDVSKENNGSLVCTRNNLNWKDNCKDKNNWRLVVWADGSSEIEHKYGLFSTLRNWYYGGHSPCNENANYLCGGEWNSTNNILII